jgi:phosphatidylserine decarboxylase
VAIQETVTFVRGLRRSFGSVGALIPTSRNAARAMSSEFARRRGPRRVLEVGALRPGDELVVYELNDAYAAYLQRRIDSEPLFQRVRDQIRLVHGNISTIDRAERFDYIISAIPFTNCPPALVEDILSSYQAVLRPGGVLTYIEYAYLRMLKARLLPGEARAQLGATSAVLERYLGYQFRRDFVLCNLPPAWVRHLRFAPAQPVAAQALEPIEHNGRIRVSLGGGGVATAALPWLAGLLAALALRPLRRYWPLVVGLALLVAGFFRDPLRRTPPDSGAVYAASDGTVTAVETLRDPRLGEGEWLRVVVFLSLLNVHINRSPVAGRVQAVWRAPGGYAAAYADEAEHNHALYTLIETPRGPVAVAQRSGLVARRIVAWRTPGELLAQGERYGLIRFGSRTDVYLPAGAAQATVAVGNTVRGGETVIARYH